MVSTGRRSPPLVPCNDDGEVIFKLQVPGLPRRYAPCGRLALRIELLLLLSGINPRKSTAVARGVLPLAVLRLEMVS